MSVSFSAVFVSNSTIARISKHYDANLHRTVEGDLLVSEVAGREYAGGPPANEARRLKDLGTHERIAVFLSAIYGNNARRHHMGIRAKQVGNQLGEDVICVSAGRLSNSSSNAASGH